LPDFIQLYHAERKRLQENKAMDKLDVEKLEQVGVNGTVTPRIFATGCSQCNSSDWIDL
jgi:hypothetical protein